MMAFELVVLALLLIRGAWIYLQVRDKICIGAVSVCDQERERIPNAHGSPHGIPSRLILGAVRVTREQCIVGDSKQIHWRLILARSVDSADIS